MMTCVATAMFLVLAAAATIHFYWAFGGLWPGHDQKSLAAAAIGDPRLDSLPPAHVNFAVAVAIALAAAWPLVAPLLHFPGLMLFSAEESDLRQLRLLHTGQQRPRGCRATDKGDELPSPHVTPDP
jgi:hypothetical protein